MIADLALRPEAQRVVDDYAKDDHDRPCAIFIKTDVTDWKQLSHMFEVAHKSFGDIDIVCPGAGVFEPPFSSFWLPPGSSESRDDPNGGRYATMDINVTHPIRTTQLAIAYFMSGKGKTRASHATPKRIVHISSIAGELAALGTPMYIASKHAVRAFIYSLATLESNLGIRVNGVAPGIIKTPLWTDHPEKLRSLTEDAETWVMPEEVAEVMLAMVEKEQYPGGTVLEVGRGHRREIPLLNNAGPPFAKAGLRADQFSDTSSEIYKAVGEDSWGCAPFTF